LPSSVSTVPSAKAGILAAIQARPGLATLNTANAITWGHPGELIQREAIFLAAAEFSEEDIAAMMTRPHKHDEKYTVPVWVDVVQEGDDPQTAETRLWTLVGEVEQAIRNLAMDAVATGVQELYINSKIPEEWLDIGGAGRGVRCRIGVYVWGRN
jgi:hypothetical protein